MMRTAIDWGVVIHTGAGNFTLASLGTRAGPMRAAMETALLAGHQVLASGGSSVDAVEATVVVLEDAPEFNAGKGAVFTHDGTHELDAAVMDGQTLSAGAVAALHQIRNPVRLARRVMERTPHVMLIGDGAEAFAREQGDIEFVAPAYFDTPLRRQQLRRALESEREHPGQPSGISGGGEESSYFGTVGAVARDRRGNLAAATSTGGLTNKRPGRVGDSPIIGAGTYASNASCAISATGAGEYFMRFTVARDICARVEYRGVPGQVAADEVVHTVLSPAGGRGGVVGLTGGGGIIMSFNCAGMGRGVIAEDGEPVVLLTRE